MRTPDGVLDNKEQKLIGRFITFVYSNIGDDISSSSLGERMAHSTRAVEWMQRKSVSVELFRNRVKANNSHYLGMKHLMFDLAESLQSHIDEIKRSDEYPFEEDLSILVHARNYDWLTANSSHENDLSEDDDIIDLTGTDRT
mgnify:CR=1 FL=1